MKIAILADDVTGALDTGVQLRKGGMPVRVTDTFPADPWSEGSTIAVNLESRHLSMQEACELEKRAAAQALQAGAELLYIKTDSALRGCIGGRLNAVLSVFPQHGILFVPAYPAMGRYTRNGVCYIDGVPITQSSIGRDLLNAVSTDHVCELLRLQGLTAPIRCVACTSDDLAPQPGEVVIADTQTMQELALVAERIRAWPKPLLLAGCAGFASVLPTLNSCHTAPWPVPLTPSPLITITGSIADATFRQIAHASRCGMTVFSLQQHIVEERSPQRTAAKLIAHAGRGSILAAAETKAASLALQQHALAAGLTTTQTSEQITATLGSIAAATLENGYRGILMIFGGDTLSGFLHAIACRELRPLHELYPGVVLAAYTWQGEERWLIAKAGSFGSAELLTDLYALFHPDIPSMSRMQPGGGQHLWKETQTCP